MEAVTSALTAAGAQWEVHDVSGAETAYWTLLAGLWAQRRSVIIVEHDVVVGPDTIRDLIDCPQGWCCAPYGYGPGEGTIVGLGCTKLSGALMVAVPDAVERAGEMSDAKHKPRSWCRLDGNLARVLVDAGRIRCFAHPPVGHLNTRGPAHNCR